MFGELKRLFHEAAVYGLSTVVGRFLNILLLPLYTHCLRPADYGLVATVFSYLGFLNVLYGYGMDFAFMRHSKPHGEDEGSPHFSTAFWSLLLSSLALSGLIHLLAVPLSAAGGIPLELTDITRYSAWILALDAMALVPFAALRMSHRPGLYASIKVANIVMNLALNYVFLVHFKLGVRGIFLASLVTSSATFAMLAPVLTRELEFFFDRGIYESLLRFALPLVPAGLASMVVQVIDRPLLKFLTDDHTVGLYQANYRLGIFMMLVVSMFDAAWRPFFIERAAQPQAKQVLARVLTYFVLGASFLFLFVSLFIASIAALPLVLGRPLIHPAYWEGLPIVPIVTLGYVFNGIYINMLAPATLAKRSELVAYATAVGAAVNIAANLTLIPRWGMMGAADATLAAYAAMAASLFWMGRRVYPIDYEYGRLAHIAACLSFVILSATYCGIGVTTGRELLRLGLLAAFPVSLAATGFFNEGERLAFRNRLGRWAGRTG